MVYGLVTDTGVPVNLSNVYARDITLGSAIVNMTTAADGKYILELMDIATNGDTIHVWTYAPNGKYLKNIFVLDVSGDAELQNLAVTNYPITETINAMTDSLAKNVTMPIASTINLMTESLAKNVTKPITSTINAMIDSVAKRVTIPVSSTIPAMTETKVITVGKNVSETIPAMTEFPPTVVLLTKPTTNVQVFMHSKNEEPYVIMKREK